MHGDRIIIAARLMQLAAKLGGMVLCDDVTHAATSDEIRFVRLRPVELKGKAGLFQPYRYTVTLTEEALHMLGGSS